jgi:predicted RNA-binding Zn-ribbon protein involved in translation (DUF1610 family)
MRRPSPKQQVSLPETDAIDRTGRVNYPDPPSAMYQVLFERAMNIQCKSCGVVRAVRSSSEAGPCPQCGDTQTIASGVAQSRGEGKATARSHSTWRRIQRNWKAIGLFVFFESLLAIPGYFVLSFWASVGLTIGGILLAAVVGLVAPPTEKEIITIRE